MICDKCGDSEITFFRQMRRDFVWVVVARCKNGHNPNKYKPFYPVENYVLKDLPELKTGVQPVRQLSFEEQLRRDYDNA